MHEDALYVTSVNFQPSSYTHGCLYCQEGEEGVVTRRMCAIKGAAAAVPCKRQGWFSQFPRCTLVTSTEEEDEEEGRRWQQLWPGLAAGVLYCSRQ